MKSSKEIKAANPIDTMAEKNGLVAHLLSRGTSGPLL